jgi:hypothetical protein
MRQRASAFILPWLWLDAISDSLCQRDISIMCVCVCVCDEPRLMSDQHLKNPSESFIGVE